MRYANVMGFLICEQCFHDLTGTYFWHSTQTFNNGICQSCKQKFQLDPPIPPIKFHESDGTERTLIYNKGDKSVGIEPGYEVDDNVYDDLKDALAHRWIDRKEREPRFNQPIWLKLEDGSIMQGVRVSNGYVTKFNHYPISNIIKWLPAPTND